MLSWGEIFVEMVLKMELSSSDVISPPSVFLASLWLSFPSSSSSTLTLLPLCASLVSRRYWKKRGVSPLSSGCQPDAAPCNTPPPEPRCCFLLCHSPRPPLSIVPGSGCWTRNFLLGPKILSVHHQPYLSSDSCSISPSPLKWLLVSDERISWKQITSVSHQHHSTTETAGGLAVAKVAKVAKV